MIFSGNALCDQYMQKDPNEAAVELANRLECSSEKGEDIWKFSFYAVDHPKGILKPGVVRLDNAAGIWILKGLPNNKTMVTYAWHGELLGNFPDFGLNKAWITQGTEVLTWLDKALSI